MSDRQGCNQLTHNSAFAVNPCLPDHVGCVEVDLGFSRRGQANEAHRCSKVAILARLEFRVSGFCRIETTQ